MDPTAWLPLLIPVLVPLAIAGLKWALAGVPRWSLPLIAIALGALADTLAALVTGASLGPLWGAVLGAAGVGVREVVDQLRQAARPAPVGREGGRR